MIASAYAMHPANTTAGDLGAHLRRTQATNSEQHLQALLRAERSDLVRLLPRVILLLKSKSVGVNYAQLMRDLWFWGGQQKFAQSRWATSFWSEWQLAEAVDESADPTGMLPDAAEAEVE
jgi:CRISPR type I-E-associated protein CasB/Cse2